MNWLLAFSDPNTQWVLAGCMLLGICSGVLGCFAFLRGRSLMGDALAHAALPGVCVAYLLTGTKSIGFFLIGAAVAGMLATYAITMITRHSRIKEDTALALTLSVFFGIGIVLLTLIQHSDSGNQSGLDKFLFGQAASLIASDVNVMIAVSLTLLTLVALFFKEFKLLAFDSGFGRGLGFPMGLLEGLLMLMLLLAVVIGLQAVGVVLMAAMLITPAVTARYWTNRLGVMTILSGVFGALAGLLGTLFSTQVNNLPTGPMIVLAASSFFLFSLFFSPSRGLLFRLFRFMKLRKKVRNDDILQTLYERTEASAKQKLAAMSIGYDSESLAKSSGKKVASIRRGLRSLQKSNAVTMITAKDGTPLWSFTPDGMEWARQIVLNQRLWDLYYMNEQRFQTTGIDKSKEEIAPQLSAAMLQEMLLLLDDYGLTPVLSQKQAPSAAPYAAKQGGVSV